MEEAREHIFSNNPTEQMDIKDIIKIEETAFYDGTNYLTNENFSYIKLETSRDEYKREQLDEDTNRICGENDFPNRENSEHIFLNDSAEHVDIKDIIKTEETVFYDGTNYWNNENFPKIKLEHGELSTNENCNDIKKEPLGEHTNSIYKENDFPNQVKSDKQWNGNGEQVSTSNSKEPPLDMEMMIEIGETNFFDGTTYLKYENCDLKAEPEHSTLENCNEYKSEREVEENKDSICEDGEFSNQETLDGEQLNENEFFEKLDESERKSSINDGIIKCVPSKPVQCQFCDNTTATRGGMKRHIEAVHFGLRSHTCQYCDYATSRLGQLKRHTNAVHHKIKNHKCEYCDYAASRPSLLKSHVNSVHLKIRNHKCEYCDYTAYELTEIKNHIRAVHLKIKNHKCEYCDYATSQSTILKTHINAVHLKIKNHKCEYCNFAASKSATLKYHLNAVHHKIKNHKCKYCDYAASQLAQIKIHTNAVHHKIKNYRCEYCDFASSQAGNLKNHMNAVHHKIENHKCECCDYRANRLRDLKDHINAVHCKIKNHK